MILQIETDIGFIIFININFSVIFQWNGENCYDGKKKYDRA